MIQNECFFSIDDSLLNGILWCVWMAIANDHLSAALNTLDPWVNLHHLSNLALNRLTLGRITNVLTGLSKLCTGTKLLNKVHSSVQS